MDKTITIITGKVELNPYGSWEDCSPGLYFADRQVRSIFEKYKDKTLKVTIEEIEEVEKED